MRFTQAVATIGLVCTVAACGTQKKQDDAPVEAQAPVESHEQKVAMDAAYAEIPGAAIVRVPVDASGNPTGEPEMRVAASKDDILTADAATATFESAQAPAKLVSSDDELDSDTSTQSWTSYSYGSSYNGGIGANCGGFSCYNSNYFGNRLRPVLHYGNNSWNYGYGRRSYNTGGYAYYCYQPNRFGYGSYGNYGSTFGGGYGTGGGSGKGTGYGTGGSYGSGSGSGYGGGTTGYGSGSGYGGGTTGYGSGSGYGGGTTGYGSGTGYGGGTTGYGSGTGYGGGTGY